MKDYESTRRVFSRPSVRSLIIRGGKIAMVHSLKYDYYKFPGGGIEEGETLSDALIRETLEESGLVVIPESIREYGVVRRIQKSDREDIDIFLQDNFYFLCDAEDAVASQRLDNYEFEERFTLEFVSPDTAIKTNRNNDHGPKCPVMLERENRVLEMLKDEGYFN